MTVPPRAAPDVSIVIPVFNKLAFTRQCLDRVWRNTGTTHAYEVVVVDNGSSDATAEHFAGVGDLEPRLRYHRNATNLGYAKGNNLGARRAAGRYLLFLNNDTLVQPGWLDAMVRVAEADARVGIVGIKQLFPYTNTIHHTGIVFTPGGVPLHLYPHADASLPHVNKQREYQAVNGACLLIGRELFEACGGFDEGYRNGYEDVDLCLAVRARGRRVICCTSAFIYHYGQITEGRTADDPGNAARFAAKWKDRIRVDQTDYYRADAPALHTPRPNRDPSSLPDDAVYFADDLSQGSALSWATADLALALKRLGVPVFRRERPLSTTLDPATRKELRRLSVPGPPRGGVQVKWSHYWPAHLELEPAGRVNLELFVINYLFGAPGSQPWDYWLQCLPENHRTKLPLTRFCKEVLLQVGVPESECHVLSLGYSREVEAIEPSSRAPGPFRFLTVTNSHDLRRYGTLLLLEAYWEAFATRDDVLLVVKDYGAGSGDTTLRDRLRAASDRATVEYRTEFTSKADLIRLYRSCDAFVSAHRGEGFGMKILDALACGLPVVTPLFGGPRDFCTPDNTLPVAFSLTSMGDCFDTRALRITNQPLWCEPDRADLVRQLRRVREEPGLAKTLGERARQDVVGRLGWEQSARRLVEITEAIRATLPASPRGRSVEARPPSQASPYWLGHRVSVVVPTYNRKATLDKCLRALERQSILPEEFEVLVVDDGSTDGTEEYVRTARFAFPLRYYRQPNQGPGAARNLGITEAGGELVLFIGDDIIADDRLLESHLIGHARHPDPSSAVLGHIDWAPWLARNGVMEYVCGEGTQQFAYDYIPRLASLDFRFFYTSNLSLKRRFLLDALEAGIRFDPCFRYAAYEDSEFAYRLMARGLELHYRADARAVHDHHMDLESFSRREYHVGQMAVVFYRKHPALDRDLQVRWIGDWLDDVERVLAQPALLEKLRAIDVRTDELLTSLARSTEELRRLDAALDPGDGRRSGSGLGSALPPLLALIFDVNRMRGKVDEWYRAVKDPARAEAARVLLGSLRKLEFLGAGPGQRQGSGPRLPPLQDPRVTALQEEAAGLRQQFGNRRVGPEPPPPARGVRRLLRQVVFGRGVFTLLRTADLYLQARLGAHEHRGWPARYHRLRSRLKRWL